MSIGRSLMRSSSREAVTVLALVLVALVLAELFSIRWLTIGATYGLLAVVVSGNEVIWGLGGLPSLGYNGFLAVGAYTAGILTATHGMTPWMSIPLAMVSALVAGAILWPFVYRLPPLYFTVATLGVGLIVPALATAMVSVTGGPSGLFGIPALSPRGEALQLEGFYRLAWVLAGVATLGVVRLARSRMGLGLKVINGHAEVASASGVNVDRLKLVAFLYGTALAGLAGSLYAFLFQAVSPETFTFILAVGLFTVQVVGGIGSGYGALVGAMAIGLLDYFTVRAGSYTSIVYGLVFLVVIGLAPDGVVGTIQRLWRVAVPRRADARAARSASLVVDRVGAMKSNASGAARPAGLFSLNITKAYGGVRACDDVTLAIPAGRVTGIVGANGAGKSTLLNALAGSARPDSGDVVLGDRSIRDLAPHARARAGIARTFQQPRAVTTMTVLDNVAVGASHCGRSGLVGGMIGGRGQRDLERQRHRARVALTAVALDHLEMLPAGELSFGQIRLMELARALALDPSVLLLDEPMSGLDADEKTTISDLLLELARNGLAIGLVEHDTSVVAGLCEHVYVMDFGSLIAEGHGAEIFTHPAVRRSYMGEEADALAEIDAEITAELDALTEADQVI